MHVILKGEVDKVGAGVRCGGAQLFREAFDEFDDAGFGYDAKALPSRHEMCPIGQFATGADGQTLEGRRFTQLVAGSAALPIGGVSQHMTVNDGIVGGHKTAGGASDICCAGGRLLGKAGGGSYAVLRLECGKSIGRIRVCFVLCVHTE